MSTTTANTPAASVQATPKDWIPGLIENGKYDATAGFIIFLIALPLSLAISLASGAPAIAGVITAVVGGILGALLSGSHLTINGAAAGLIVIVLGAVQAVGYRGALAIGLICGVLQILAGLVKAGKLTNMFPLHVVHGMLAGIGMIVMAKQIHVALGVTVKGSMVETIAAIPSSFAGMVPSVALIGGISLLIMILWPRLGAVVAFAKKVPAPLVVAIVAVLLAQALNLDKKYLVSVPLNFMDSFAFPDFSKAAEFVFWKFVIIYLLVASLESLLTASAVDKMDPWKRRSNMNRELVGKGAANALSAAIGGLPMIAEVVRSSANVMNGARTRWSNVFHGVFLLIAVAAFPQILNMIPVAALAGMLVFIGFRLAHPKEFAHALHIGKEELFFMVVTAAIVLTVDLLWGVIIGFLVAVAVNLLRGGVAGFFKAGTAVQTTGATTTLKLSGPIGFNNYMGIRSTLDALPKGKALTIDLSAVTFMDHTVRERLHDFELEYAGDGGTVGYSGIEALQPSSHHAYSALVRNRA